MGQEGPPGAKKWLFSKMIPDVVECQNKCFWCILSSWWPGLALLKSQNALEIGCFGTKNGSKMGQKCIFPKVILDHSGCPNKRTQPIFEPIASHFGLYKVTKCFENGLFWDKKWVQKWVKKWVKNLFFQK